MRGSWRGERPYGHDVSQGSRLLLLPFELAGLVKGLRGVMGGSRERGRRFLGVVYVQLLPTAALRHTFLMASSSKAALCQLGIIVVKHLLLQAINLFAFAHN